ncbi:DUF551 domain-containing protein [Escherichia coli]|nr:DUF551 domain-containing protein [Escherichia coli]
MTTITKERLLTIKQWRETYGPGSNVVLPAEEAEELARIALASLEAEPVGDFYEYKPGDWYQRSVGDKAPKWVPLYATPPVPELQADVAQAIENLKQKLVECNRYNYCADAVKGVEDACHAAMLQGSQPVSQTYKLPVNTPCQDAPAHIWLQTAGVWPEDGELSELTWCSHNQHHDDTLYVRADLVNGNSPVTPDGWISCSERMPDDGQHVIILCDGAFVLYAQYRDGEFFDIVRNGDEFFETQSRNVTHWMPLPEPPQEVK